MRKIIGIGETILDIIFRTTNPLTPFREVPRSIRSFRWED